MNQTARGGRRRMNNGLPVGSAPTEVGTHHRPTLEGKRVGDIAHLFSSSFGTAES